MVQTDNMVNTDNMVQTDNMLQKEGALPNIVHHTFVAKEVSKKDLNLKLQDIDSEEIGSLPQSHKMLYFKANSFKNDFNMVDVKINQI